MGVASDVLLVSCGAVLGVLTRVALGRAFGQEGANIVSSRSVLFLDLPANALGSFLAGVYIPLHTRAIRVHPSLHHAISTGYFGSVTSTFNALRCLCQSYLE
jgi:fluoride ion exporter CrcB/FEX